MKHGIAVILLAASLALTGCFDTRPSSRVHAAASVPRFVDVNSASFNEDGKVLAFGTSLGAGYGTAWSDVGNVHGAQIFHVGFRFKGPNYAIGWQPFFGVAKTNVEGTNGWGHTIWAAGFFGGGQAWRFSGQSSFTYSTKTAEEQGCSNGSLVFFTTISCTGQPTVTANAKVVIHDVGFTLTAERNLGGRGSLLLAPSLHWTHIVATNEIDGSAANTRYAATFWSPGIQLGYALKVGDELQSSLVFLAGAEYAKTFRPDRAVREWVPTADVRWQF